jgi:iron complex transport system substrate-binding protein
VYCCNTVGTTLFEDFPFHPDVLLHEFIVIFHPELDKGYKLKYFQPLADE